MFFFLRFKERHGIRELAVQGERLSSDFQAAEKFRKEFADEMQKMGYMLELIYNADVSGLYWRLLPIRTFASRSEISAPGRKMSKDRVTIMLWLFLQVKIPLFIINKKHMIF